MAIINGTNDPDNITGTGRDDIITGLRGDDIVRMGFGNDRFVWNPGDGNDTVNGEAGTDTLAFNGANIAEAFLLSAIGTHAQLNRNVANITMDLSSIEHIELRTLGGADTVTINDLSATAVRQVAVDLGGSLGGGDGAADTVIVNRGTGSNDVRITETAGKVSIVDWLQTVTLSNAESGDGLVVNGLGGNDVLNAGGLRGDALKLTLDGGAGNDTITGGNGHDVLVGGDGNDTVVGGHGNDVALLGSGDDLFTWNAGDGNDTVEGQSGTDSVVLNGNTVAETIQVLANGGRVLLTDSVDAVSLDMNGVERLGLHTLGGADNVLIGDLTGTGLNAIGVDLARDLGRTTVDAALDTVFLTGTATGADTVKIASSAQDVLVTGLAAAVTVTHAGSNDQLTISTLGGDDVIDASQLGAGRMQLFINAGSGADTITGSAGDDTVSGGQGNDIAMLGAGNDRFIWGPGDGNDTVNGQAGTDTLEFRGANIAEVIGLTADGTHAQFTRNVANIAIDLESIERVEIKSLGGADSITIGDLTGTAVKQVAIDLGSSLGGGGDDGAVDAISANLSNAKDVVKLTQGTDGVLTVASATETITVANAGAGDHLTVSGLGGDDTLDASALKAGAMGLTMDGGSGNDLIFGGAGADTLFGGEGNDTVTWSIGGGNDLIDGGNGFDTLVLNGTSGDDTVQVLGSGDKLSVTGSDGASVDVSGMEEVRISGGAGRDSISIGDLSTTNIDKVSIDLGAGSKGDSVTVQNGSGEVMVIESKGSQTIITNQNTFQTITIDNMDSSDVLNVNSTPGNVPSQVIQASALAMSLHFLGGNNADTIFSGSGDDFIDGNQGNDVALMGAGNDIYNWDPGDGSDTVDGQAGFDTLRFNGSNASENIDIVADGARAELTRNIANIDMHLNSVERIEVHALAGTDNIHVHDMSGTVVKEVSVDLAFFNGTTDGALDTVTVEGTAGNDHVAMSSSNGVVTMSGLPAQVTVSGGELDDEIRVNGGDGNDTIDASGVQSGNPHMTLDGGAGNDAITGGADGDLIFGGDGHDVLKGGGGADTIDGGSGDDDIFGGQGDDILSGGDGADVFHVTGMLDGHDLINGFTAGQDKLDLSKLFDDLGVAAGDRAGKVSITDNGGGAFDVAVDADGNAANGFEHVVATIHSNGPITVGHEVVVNG